MNRLEGWCGVMKTGTLIYDPLMNRIDVRYVDGSSYGGLHCGTTLEVFYNGEWIPTRIECADDWYLVGIPQESLYGLQARI